MPLIPIGDVDAQVLPSGPAYETDNVPLLLTTLLYAARTRAVITTPYFIPDAALLTAIASAARRGVDVHLVVSAQGDQFLVSRAQRSYYEEMLDAGVKIHAVPAPALVHAKHLSIDDDIVMIGSSNMDVRSFRLNLEITLLVYDRTVNAAMRAIEQRYFARATQLSWPSGSGAHGGSSWWRIPPGSSAMCCDRPDDALFALPAPVSSRAHARCARPPGQ